MEILVTMDELASLLSRALGSKVTQVTFMEGSSGPRVNIETGLDLLGVAAAATTPAPVVAPPSSVISPPVNPAYPEATAEEMEELLLTNQALMTGVVFEYHHDGEVTTRERNEDEANLPPGEPIIYVRDKD